MKSGIIRYLNKSLCILRYNSSLIKNNKQHYMYLYLSLDLHPHLQRHGKPDYFSRKNKVPQESHFPISPLFCRTKQSLEEGNEKYTMQVMVTFNN